jgi:hypothetical protein
MTITLTVGATALILPADLFWSDETGWQPVEQTIKRTITGSLIVQSATRVAGRPITLEPEDDSSAWASRDTVDQLYTWASVPGQVLILNLRGTNRNVIFRHQDGGFQAKPVAHFSDVLNTDWYLTTIRLMEI